MKSQCEIHYTSVRNALVFLFLVSLTVIVHATPPEGDLVPFLGDPTCEMQQVYAGDRFPNVAVATDGTVLAFWQGVKVRRSEDGGKTWGDEILVGEGFMGGGVTVDENSGHIFAFVEQRHPPADVAIYRSTDHGKTWSIQEAVIQPDQQGHAPSMHMNEHGITLRHGPHKGRLIRPTRWYAGKNDRSLWPEHYTNAIYSDDNGKTWQTSEPFPANGTGEATLAELSDGRIYYNSRRHWAPEGENPRRRWTAVSEDGGATWKDLAICKILPDGDQDRDYGLMAGLTRLPVKGRDVLVFSNIESPSGRHHGNVWASFDGGRTWPLKRQIYEGGFAYSSLEAGRPGTPSEGWIYLHFEGGPKGGGTLARFNLSWLLEGEMTGDGAVPDWTVATRVSAERPRKPTDGVWRLLPSSLEEGLLAERVDVWRQERLWHMLDAENGYLLSGFESRPGRHPWQGEHVGKWLHAATLAYEQTRDERLLKALQETVGRLLATQLPNGYLGTYDDDYTFMALPENESVRHIVDDVAPQENQGTQKKRAAKPRGGWDTWTLRYNIYGLLTYEQFHPDKRVLDACRRMVDLLIEVYGDGDADLTKYGTRQGISATTLLESIVMLYDRTQDQKYLDFAQHIVAMSENNPKLRLMGAMLDRESVVYSGDGKAYQLMANLLGYLGLYRNTGDERYLKTVQNARHDIKTRHVDVTGGPWGRHMTYNGNRECFALLSDYDPAAVDVETCSTTTWVQLNQHLLEVTGQAKYAAEAERAVFNAIMAAQHADGLDWCYYIRANQDRRPYERAIKAVYRREHAINFGVKVV